MAALALRGFSSIASRAMPVFRTIWSTIKASPTLSAIKDAVIGEALHSGMSMMERFSARQKGPIKNVWDVAQ